MGIIARFIIVLSCTALLTGCLGLETKESVVDLRKALTPIKEGNYKIEVIHPMVMKVVDDVTKTVRIINAGTSYTKIEHTGPYNTKWPKSVSFAFEKLENNFYIMSSNSKCHGWTKNEYCNYLVMVKGNDLYQWMSFCETMGGQYGLDVDRITNTKDCEINDKSSVRKIFKALKKSLMKLPPSTRHFSAGVRYIYAPG